MPYIIGIERFFSFFVREAFVVYEYDVYCCDVWGAHCLSLCISWSMHRRLMLLRLGYHHEKCYTAYKFPQSSTQIQNMNKRTPSVNEIVAQFLHFRSVFNKLWALETNCPSCWQNHRPNLPTPNCQLQMCMWRQSRVLGRLRLGNSFVWQDDLFACLIYDLSERSVLSQTTE